ncbi:MAG: hypothetical protein GEU28_11810 [Dehalococcoidia bacterium]|nr:hypothetical protein [Dehalococcoidia bacterium]
MSRSRPGNGHRGLDRVVSRRRLLTGGAAATAALAVSGGVLGADLLSGASRPASRRLVESQPAAETAAPRQRTVPTPAPTSAPTPDPRYPDGPFVPGPDTRLWGVFEPGAPSNIAALAGVERAVGNPQAIHWYQSWSGPGSELDPVRLNNVREYGALPMISWEPAHAGWGTDQPPYALARLAAGDHDDYARSWARGIRDHGGPVVIRFAHEMNHGHFAWAAGVNGNTPEQYVAAWRHVRQIFLDEGAQNASFSWSPNIAYDGTTPFDQLYPGDEHVDWIGLSGFNGGSDLPWGGWLEFGPMFLPSYEVLVGYGKPMMITEVACTENGGDKAAWIRRAFTDALPNVMPRFQVVCWFNENVLVDWRVQSSPSSADAFVETAGTWRQRTP